MKAIEEEWQTQSYKILIRETHLDSYGHMNNATYLQIFEEARWEFITQNGWGYKKIHETRQGPVVLEANVSFRKEINLRQLITIESRIIEYTSRVGTLEQKMLDEESNVCAYATFKFGFFDLKERKLLIAPPEWLQALGKQTP